MKGLGALKAGKFPHGAVFGTMSGYRMSSSRCWLFGGIVKRAGLVDDKGQPRFSVHDLRGSCATELLRRGVPPKTVQRILGHSSLTTTMNYYAGVTDKDLQNAMKRLESRTA